MSDYHAPVKDMLFALDRLAGLESISRLPGFEEATPDLIAAVLEEAAQLANEVIAPINAVGDREGTRIENDQVVVPESFKTAYRQLVEDGWSGISYSAEIGGQGLPYSVGLAVEEMWQSSSLAWSLCALLTQGAVRAIQEHASEAAQAVLLDKMVAGEWTGTMNLTEPQAGSDLSLIRSSAVPDGDGYRITGQKIYITWGDHDMTENVIHLILARLEGAPAGVKGLSLFAVPKRLIGADGSSGEGNDVVPVSVEHKLGIHGSPTCVMSFDNSYGYLVGEENNGLACMFTMMNHARLSVGLEGVAISERAYQLALAYARDRVQGGKQGHDGPVTIIEHADVRRMLMQMKSMIEAMRGLAYATGAHLDRAEREPDEAERAREKARLELLVPVVKGWCTEQSQLLTSLGIQIHGGMGYVEETGAAQHYRDARITTIYEGTTGIQANDFIGRKVLRDEGAALNALIADMQGTVADLERYGERLAGIRTSLGSAVADLAAAGEWLAAHYADSPDTPGAASYHLLMLTGTVAGGWQMAIAAAAAADALEEGSDDAGFHSAKLVTAQFYAEQSLPLSAAYRRAIESGADAVMGLTGDQF